MFSLVSECHCHPLNEAWSNTQKYLTCSTNLRSTSLFFWGNTITVACLGYGRHGTCHGRHFDWGAKIAWEKVKFLITVTWTTSLRTMQSLTANASTQRPYLMQASCSSTIKFYDKTGVLWHNTMVRHCDKTRTLACHLQDLVLFTLSRKAKSVCAAEIQAIG